MAAAVVAEAAASVCGGESFLSRQKLSKMLIRVEGTVLTEGKGRPPIGCGEQSTSLSLSLSLSSAPFSNLLCSLRARFAQSAMLTS